MLVMSQQLPGEAESTREHQSTRAGTTEGHRRHRSLLHRAQSHALCTLLTRMGPRYPEAGNAHRARTDCPACSARVLAAAATCQCHGSASCVSKLQTVETVPVRVPSRHIWQSASGPV